VEKPTPSDIEMLIGEIESAGKDMKRNRNGAQILPIPSSFALAAIQREIRLSQCCLAAKSD
jgi:hypothetical protein